MLDNLYCEPCHGLLVGKVNIISERYDCINFKHHDTFESFNKALRLPCAICTLVYAYSGQMPTALGWKKLLGSYQYFGDEHRLYFNTIPDVRSPEQRAYLALVPESGE